MTRILSVLALALASIASAQTFNDCRVKLMSEDASRVVVTCPQFAPGVAIFYSTPDPKAWDAENQWKRVAPKADTVKADSTKKK